MDALSYRLVFMMIICGFINLSASGGADRLYWPLEYRYSINSLNDELARILEIRRNAKTDELRRHVDISKDLLDEVAKLTSLGEGSSIKTAKIKMQRCNLDVKIAKLIKIEQKQESR